MIMLSGINVFKSTLFFLVWAEVLLHLEHDMKFTSGKSSLQTHFGRPGNKNLPSGLFHSVFFIYKKQHSNL